MATILHLYGNQVTELQLLQAMDIQDGMTSFEEMAQILPSLGFKAQGLAVSFEQLSQLGIVKTLLHNCLISSGLPGGDDR